jgi:hypothetical protein
VRSDASAKSFTGVAAGARSLRKSQSNLPLGFMLSDGSDPTFCG